MFGSTFRFLKRMKMSLMCRTIYDTNHRILQNAMVSETKVICCFLLKLQYKITQKEINLI